MSRLVEFKVTLSINAQSRNPFVSIVVTLSGRVRNWRVLAPKKVLKVVGIVVSVLVLWKMTVLKDGQLLGAEVRYDTLDTSRNSVVNLGSLWITALGLSVVMEGDNVMEDMLEPLNVSFSILVSVLLRVKSKEPTRFTQLHAY